MNERVVDVRFHCEKLRNPLCHIENGMLNGIFAILALSESRVLFLNSSGF